ncbi:MAG: hypothetical protein WA125_00410 [Desulfosporosinus sp.]
MKYIDKNLQDIFDDLRYDLNGLSDKEMDIVIYGMNRCFERGLAIEARKHDK